MWLKTVYQTFWAKKWKKIIDKPFANVCFYRVCIFRMLYCRFFEDTQNPFGEENIFRASITKSEKSRFGSLDRRYYNHSMTSLKDFAEVSMKESRNLISNPTEPYNPIGCSVDPNPHLIHFGFLI